MNREPVSSTKCGATQNQRSKASVLEKLREGYDLLKHLNEQLSIISEGIADAISGGSSTEELNGLLKKKLEAVSALEKVSKRLVQLREELESYPLSQSDREYFASLKESLKESMVHLLERHDENRSTLSRNGISIRRPY